MKAIIAGGRDFIPTQEHYDWLVSQLVEYSVDTVFSGGCRGADDFGASTAYSIGIEVVEYFAQWHKHGTKAGPIRNEAMAKHADICILFPGGWGTADMRKRALRHKLTIIEYREVLNG